MLEQDSPTLSFKSGWSFEDPEVLVLIVPTDESGPRSEFDAYFQSTNYPEDYPAYNATRIERESYSPAKGRTQFVSFAPQLPPVKGSAVAVLEKLAEQIGSASYPQEYTSYIVAVTPFWHKISTSDTSEALFQAFARGFAKGAATIAQLVFYLPDTPEFQSLRDQFLKVEPPTRKKEKPNRSNSKKKKDETPYGYGDNLPLDDDSITQDPFEQDDITQDPFEQTPDFAQQSQKPPSYAQTGSYGKTTKIDPLDEVDLDAHFAKKAQEDDGPNMRFFRPQEETLERYSFTPRVNRLLDRTPYSYSAIKSENSYNSSYGILTYIWGSNQPDQWNTDTPENAFEFLVEWLNKQHEGAIVESAIQKSISIQSYPKPSFEGVAITSELIGILDKAEEIEKVTHGRGVYSREIGGRHLIAAFLLHQPESATEANNALNQLVSDYQPLYTDFFRFLEKPNFPRDNLAAWAKLLNVEYEIPEGEIVKDGPSIPVINTDSPEGKDLLDVEKEAEAFSRLIASKQVKPPLSIGIFGKWGAGKSFFMGKMREIIQDLSEATMAAGAPSETDEDGMAQGSFCENIVQIEFNAWHYVDANLWASLVTHIFDQLEHFSDDANDRKKVRQALYEKLESAYAMRMEYLQKTAELEAQIQDRKGKLAELEAKRAAEKEKLSLNRLKDAISIVWEELIEEKELTVEEDVKAAAKQLGVPHAQLMHKRASEIAHDLEQTSVEGQVFIAWLKKKSPKQYIAAAAVFVIVAILMFAPGLINSEEGSAWLKGLLSSVAPLGLLIFQYLNFARKHTKQISSVLTKVNGFTGRFETRWKAIEIKKTEDEKQHEETLRQLETQYAALTQELAAKEVEYTTARQELTDIASGKKLGKFIRDRANSNDYRQHLGIISLIRRDFQLLSELLAEPEEVMGEIQQRRELAREAAQATGNEKPNIYVKEEELTKDDLLGIERIVLYIDDLDRCPSDKVVEVLQAVHLLMSFPLFVVVVGVDARWVKQALLDNYDYMKEYEELVREAKTLTEQHALYGKSATPFDYLEKIFQVPFWIKSMETEAARGYIKGLVGKLAESDWKKPEKDTLKSKSIEPMEDEKGELETLDRDDIDDINDLDTAEVITRGPKRSRSTPKNEKINLPSTVPSQTGTPKSAETTAGTTEETVPESPAEDSTPEQVRLMMPLQHITPVELALMELLAPLLGSTPRTAKRFLNTFRLLKAKREWGPGSDVRDWDEKMAVMMALGILITCPGIATDLFTEINWLLENQKVGPLRPRLRDFIAHTRQLEESDMPPSPIRDIAFLQHPEWTHFVGDLNEIRATKVKLAAEIDPESIYDIKLDRLLVGYDAVIRYSFRIIKPMK